MQYRIFLAYQHQYKNVRNENYDVFEIFKDI